VFSVIFGLGEGKMTSLEHTMDTSPIEELDEQKRVSIVKWEFGLCAFQKIRSYALFQFCDSQIVVELQGL
jgi:hypothetical protein